MQSRQHPSHRSNQKATCQTTDRPQKHILYPDNLEKEGLYGSTPDRKLGGWWLVIVCGLTADLGLTVAANTEYYGALHTVTAFSCVSTSLASLACLEDECRVRARVRAGWVRTYWCRLLLQEHPHRKRAQNVADGSRCCMLAGYSDQVQSTIGLMLGILGQRQSGIRSPADLLALSSVWATV